MFIIGCSKTGVFSNSGRGIRVPDFLAVRNRLLRVEFAKVKSLS